MSDNPEPFAKQQRRIQEAAQQIAEDERQSVYIRMYELAKAMSYVNALFLSLEKPFRETGEEIDNA